MKRYELTPREWERIEKLLPAENRGKGRPAKDNRKLWVARSEAAWRALPECCGPWQTVYSKFRKWRDEGVLEKVLMALTADAYMENLSIASTSVRVHASANGGKKTEDKAIGISRGGKTTNLLSKGNDHDSSRAVEVLEQLDISGSNILGDKAYGAKAIRKYICSAGAVYTIPPKSNDSNPWFCDWWLYKERHLIECFFAKLKWFRRLAMRFDKLDPSFLAFAYLTSIAILVK